MGLFEVDPKHRKQALDTLIKESAPTSDFFLMLLMSVVIVTVGLLINNASIIIGGMLVAPLLYPILALGMSVVLADTNMMRRSIYVIVKSIVLSLVIAGAISLFFIGLLDKESLLQSEILDRAHPSLAYLLVSIAAGVAAAFAFTKKELSEALPGIAVSVALIPPIAVMGIGFAFVNWGIITGALGLFGLNLLGIVFASFIVFSFMNYHDQRRDAAKFIAKEEKELEKEENGEL